MKTHILKVVFGFLLSGLVSADVVSIRSDVWYPINGEPGSSKPGYMIELAKSILAEHGHAVDYEVLSWKGSLTMVRRGEYDCIVGAGHDDAPDFIFSKKPWGVIKAQFYAKRNSSWRYTGIPSLANTKVGVIGDYSYSKDLDAYIARSAESSIEVEILDKKVQVVRANNALRQNIGKLLTGLIDTTVAFDMVMASRLKELDLVGQIKTAGELEDFDDGSIYIACSPNKPSSKRYIELFTTGIDKMRSNGRLQQILDKYGLTDWEYSTEETSDSSL